MKDALTGNEVIGSVVCSPSGKPWVLERSSYMIGYGFAADYWVVCLTTEEKCGPYSSFEAAYRQRGLMEIGC